MKEFNAAFFSLYENVFIAHTKLHGIRNTLEFFTDLFSRTLGEAYLTAGFSRGNIDHFEKVVKERDEGVGLSVAFPLISPNKIIYQFLQDPFPNLKEFVNWKELDKTYLNFKVKFLLGDQWTYNTTQHIWDGYPFTEHVIFPEK